MSNGLVKCGIRKHSFWNDPVRDMLTYLYEQRPWVKKIIVIAHNAKAFDLHFILKRAVFLKSRPELVMSGQKIIMMKVEHRKFMDSMFSAISATQVIQCIRSDRLQIVVPALLQYRRKPELCWFDSGCVVLWCGRH